MLRNKTRSIKNTFLTQIHANLMVRLRSPLALSVVEGLTQMHADFTNKTICDHLRYIRENLRLRYFFRALCVILFSICVISVFAQEQFTYDAKNKRDPFIPLVTSDGRLLKLEQEEAVTGLFLEGIIYDKFGLSCAIVNGEVVKIGDKAGDYQVLRIEVNKVIFIKEGMPLEIELKKEEP